MFDFLFQAFAGLVAFFYRVIPSYGVAIILLTVAVRLVLFPLTAKQAKSMQKIQQIQPELKRLQAKYKNDRQKLNEEMMKFYKENSINPLAGCLPLLLQLPLFFVLYRVIAGLTHKGPNGVPDPMYISKTSELYQSLSQAGGKMVSWGMDLAKSAAEHHGSLTSALPYYLLVALVVLTGYWQQRQMTARSPQGAAGNQQAQLMGKIFPVVFGFISLNIAAGVVVYFVVSNAWQIAQQALIFRQQPAPTGTSSAAGASGKAAPPSQGKLAPPKSDGEGDGARSQRSAGSTERPRNRKGRK